jgi:hypothetical protein
MFFYLKETIFFLNKKIFLKHNMPVLQTDEFRNLHSGGFNPRFGNIPLLSKRKATFAHSFF